MLEEFLVLLMVQGFNAQFVEQPAAGTRTIPFNDRVTLSCSVEEQYLIDWEVTFDNGQPILAARTINNANFAQRNFTIIGVATRTSTLSFGILDSVGSETNNGTTIVCIAQQGTTPTRGSQVQVIFSAPATDPITATTSTTSLVFTTTQPETATTMTTVITMATVGDNIETVIGIVAGIFAFVVVLAIGGIAGFTAIFCSFRNMKKDSPPPAVELVYEMQSPGYEVVPPYENYNGHVDPHYEELDNLNGHEAANFGDVKLREKPKGLKLHEKTNGHVSQVVNHSSGGTTPVMRRTHYSDIVPGCYTPGQVGTPAGGTPGTHRRTHYSDVVPGYFTPGYAGTPAGGTPRLRSRHSDGYSTPGTPTLVILRNKFRHSCEANSGYSTPRRVNGTPTGGTPGVFARRRSHHSDVIPVYYFNPGQPDGGTPVMFRAKRTRHHSDAGVTGQPGTPVGMRQSREHPVLSHAYSALPLSYGFSDSPQLQTASTAKPRTSSDIPQPPKPRASSDAPQLSKICASSDAPMEAAGEHHPLYSCDQRTLRHNTSIAPPPPFPECVCTLESPPPDLDLYTVKQDYCSDQPEHLSVSKGEKVLVLWKTENGDWFRAVNIEEGVGWVPGSFLSKYHSLENYSWFHDIATEDAYKILCKSSCHWSFLVKNSESRPDEYTIGMYCANEITYYHIFFKNDLFYVTSAISFESIAQLLLFYSKDYPHFFRRVLFLHPISNKWGRQQKKFFEEPTPLPPSIPPPELSTIEPDSKPDVITSELDTIISDV